LTAEGWRFARDGGLTAQVSDKGLSGSWDGRGGRHCPSYARGVHPDTGNVVERLYYAGAGDNKWGPYSIGCLEWRDGAWQEDEEPVFSPQEEWEGGSVFEPNVLYAGGQWHLWYACGSAGSADRADGDPAPPAGVGHGYAVSRDGRTNWTRRAFSPAQAWVHDFAPRQLSDGGFGAIFACISPERDKAGLWWCRADQPQASLAAWGPTTRLAGPGFWKPSWIEKSDGSLFITADNSYEKPQGAPGIPVYFTIDVIQATMPS
jgi:hypothetical protein